MSYAGSGGDDQSEDGELRHSPADAKSRQEEILDFSLSDEDADTADSLDIKPPQASSRLPRTSSKGRRRDRREGRSRHSRTERHREERTHGHRDKHHRERTRERSSRTEYREYPHKDMYRYQEGHGSASQQMVGKYLEHSYRRQDELVALATQNIRYERRERHEKHEMRYVQEQEKTRRYEEKERRMKSAADQTLDDLRERLLDKKRLKDATDDKEPKRRHRSADHQDLSSLEQDAEMYVQEIIDLSGEEKKLGNKHEEDLEPMHILSKEEDEEQELRKEKLLQADRERARQKEQYKLERERRHQRRLERQEAKRKMQEEQMKEEKRKKQRISGELSIVTVSDASSVESSRSNSPISAESRASSTSRSSSTEEDLENEVENQPESTHSQASVASNEKEILEPSPVAAAEPVSPSPSNQSSSSPSPTSPSKTQQVATTPAVKAPEVTKAIDVSLPPYLPAIQGCRSVEEFQCLNRIEEGTYGVVYRAKDKRTDEIVALKRLKMEKEKEGFPITSLREINTLLKGQHPNIVTVREIVVGSNMDKIFIVMDYVEHDLKSLMETMRNRRQVFVPGEVKCLLKQLLRAVAHLHDNWILHRDLKTSNLLLSHKGILKVGDFGLAREYGSPLKAYTPIVVTLWYRAPELLLCAKEYSTPVDMWSVGCIFAELLLMNALFPGKSEIDQLNRIFKELGTPNERVWPAWSTLPAVKKMKFTEYPGTSLPQKFSMLSECGLGLLRRLLTYDPTKRSTAEDGARHAWFSEAPLPIHPDMFPTWPAKSELGHRKALAASPKPPSGGKEYKQLGDGDEDSALGFHMGSSGASSSLMEGRRLAMGAGFSLRF